MANRLPLKTVAVSTALLLLSISPLAMADADTMHKTIQVQGRGVITTKPDSFNINFSVTSQGKTMNEAKQKNNEIAQNITAKIKALAIPSMTIQTQWYNASPTYKYDKSGKSNITGYQVNNNMMVNVKAVDSAKIEDYASKVIDTATDNNATNTGDPNFYLSDNNVAYDDALKLAVKQAKHRADILATEAGAQITMIDTIDSQTQSSPQAYAAPRMMSMAKADMESNSIPTQVMAGPLDIEASVVIRYTIK